MSTLQPLKLTDYVMRGIVFIPYPNIDAECVRYFEVWTLEHVNTFHTACEYASSANMDKVLDKVGKRSSMEWPK